MDVRDNERLESFSLTLQSTVPIGRHTEKKDAACRALSF
jgi:hypothetical protein